MTTSSRSLGARLALAFLPLALVALAACGDDDDDDEAATDDPVVTEDTSGEAGEDAATDPESGVTFTVALTGAVEVPGPGDPDGAGTMELTVDPEAGEVCHSVQVSGVDDIQAGHIHQGPTGEAGPPVVTFADPTADVPTCQDADPAVLQQVIDEPAGFYVNLHNPEFPDGAVRGQLG